jgi:hypothetical protein
MRPNVMAGRVFDQHVSDMEVGKDQYLSSIIMNELECAFCPDFYAS